MSVYSSGAIIIPAGQLACKQAQMGTARPRGTEAFYEDKRDVSESNKVTPAALI